VLRVRQCAEGDQGQQLLHDSHFNTMGLFAKHGGYSPPGHGYRPPLIPVVWIFDKDGQPDQYNNPLRPAANPYGHLLRKVCAAYTGTKPAACAPKLQQ
jgi:hypothetical protein